MRAPIALAGLGLGLAFLATYACCGGEATQPPRELARTAAPAREAPPRPGGPAARPSEGDASPESPSRAGTRAGAGAEAPTQSPRLPGERGPQREEPALGPRSWIVPLQLGWEGAEAGEPIARDFAFQPHPDTSAGERFQAWVQDAAGVTRSYLVPVAGLLPREAAAEQEELFQGDQHFTRRAPALLRLPELALPARLDLCSPEGQEVASYTLREVEGSLRITPR